MEAGLRLKWAREQEEGAKHEGVRSYKISALNVIANWQWGL